MQRATKKQMKASDVLKKYGWCRGTFARNAQGSEVRWNSPEATHFCIFGAYAKAYDVEPSFLFALYNKLEKKLKQIPYHWNDTVCKSKAEAIRLLKSIGE